MNLGRIRTGKKLKKWGKREVCCAHLGMSGKGQSEGSSREGKREFRWNIAFKREAAGLGHFKWQVSKRKKTEWHQDFHLSWCGMHDDIENGKVILRRAMIGLTCLCWIWMNRETFLSKNVPGHLEILDCSGPKIELKAICMEDRTGGGLYYPEIYSKNII